MDFSIFSTKICEKISPLSIQNQLKNGTLGDKGDDQKMIDSVTRDR